jgi:membrane-bound metal-dependent hydrolase YbcI (DUF457 family)
MPSPIGHLLAGLTVGWLTEPRTQEVPTAGTGDDATPRTAEGLTTHHSDARALTPFVLWCAVVAALPDVDLLVPQFHRTATHSLTATLLILIITLAVTGKVTGAPAWRLAFALAGAHATHLLLDWLGADPSPPRGFELLWPFSGRFFISGLDLFPGTERRIASRAFVAVNLRAAIVELAVLGPCAVVAWWVRRKRRSRVPISVRDVPPRPFAGAAGTAGTSDRPGLREAR